MKRVSIAAAAVLLLSAALYVAWYVTWPPEGEDIDPHSITIDSQPFKADLVALGSSTATAGGKPIVRRLLGFSWGPITRRKSSTFILDPNAVIMIDGRRLPARQPKGRALDAALAASLSEESIADVVRFGVTRSARVSAVVSLEESSDAAWNPYSDGQPYPVVVRLELRP